jgi:hypothetical protein
MGHAAIQKASYFTPSLAEVCKLLDCMRECCAKNKVLRKIYLANKEEVTGEQRNDITRNFIILLFTKYY